MDTQHSADRWRRGPELEMIESASWLYSKAAVLVSNLQLGEEVALHHILNQHRIITTFLLRRA